MAERFPMSISAFFPFYNEEANIAATVTQAHETLAPLVTDYEIILVDDGSTDRTAQLADELAERHPRVRAVHHPKNRGYGAALRSGFQSARHDWVFFTDGDGQFDLAELPHLLERLNGAAAAIGYRLHRQEGWVRRLNGWAWTMLVNSVFGLRFRDIDCAFKIFPRTFVAGLELKSEGALVSAELLAKAKNMGLSVAEVGIQHYPRRAGQPTGANPAVILRAFRELFALRKYIRDWGREYGVKPLKPDQQFVLPSPE